MLQPGFGQNRQFSFAALWRDFIDKEDFFLEAAELRYEGPAAEQPEDAAWDAKMAAERHPRRCTT
jgi:hypothetical protein